MTSTQQPHASPIEKQMGVAPVIAPEGEPIEFIYKGQRFHVYSILSRWREAGGWWNRISDGNSRLPYGDGALSEMSIIDDGARSLWRVEAAPIGMVGSFEIEHDEITKRWAIRPASRTHSN
jgi:hypothetical protein